MKNSEFPVIILREVAIGGTRYSPGDIAVVTAEIFRELVAIFAADPKDRPRRNSGKSAARRSH